MEYLEKFEYNESTIDNIKDRLVTWDGRKVEFIRTIKTSASNVRLLALVHDFDDTIKVVLYTLTGLAPGETDHSLDLYIDNSSTKYANVSKVSDEYELSKLYDSFDEARRNLKDHEYDTISIKIPIK